MPFQPLRLKNVSIAAACYMLLVHSYHTQQRARRSWRTSRHYVAAMAISHSQHPYNWISWKIPGQPRRLAEVEITLSRPVGLDPQHLAVHSRRRR